MFILFLFHFIFLVREGRHWLMVDGKTLFHKLASLYTSSSGFTDYYHFSSLETSYFIKTSQWRVPRAGLA